MSPPAFSDDQIDAALLEALEKAAAREPEGRERDQLERGIADLRSGEHLPPEIHAKFRLVLRDLVAILSATPTGRNPGWLKAKRELKRQRKAGQ